MILYSDTESQDVSKKHMKLKTHWFPAKSAEKVSKQSL